MGQREIALKQILQTTEKAIEELLARSRANFRSPVGVLSTEIRHRIDNAAAAQDPMSILGAPSAPRRTAAI